MVIQFPAPQDYGGASPYGAYPVRFWVSAPDHKVETYTYKDGNATHLLWSDTYDLIFNLEYELLTEAQAKVFDDHYLSARGEYLGFSFYNWRLSPGVMYTDVHYLRYERPAGVKQWIQSRRIQLIKRGVAIA